MGPNVQVTTTSYEAEEEIAVHPHDPDFLLAAISDFSIDRYGYIGNTTKYAWSRDGGSTWNESFAALDNTPDRAPITGDGITWQRMSDPVVAIDGANNIAYMSNLYFMMFSNANGAYVSAAPIHHGNVSFTAAATRPVVVNTDPNTGFFEDKEWIAVDNSPRHATKGNVYVAWVHYLDLAHQGFGGEIHVAASNDHAATFKPGAIVSPPDQVNAVQGPQVAVDNAGRVVVSWTYCLNYLVNPNPYANSNCLLSQVWGAVSTDGGDTFSNPIQISPTITDLDGNGFPSYYRKWSAPAMAVDPRTGAPVIVYTDQPGASSAVEYIRCQPGFAGPCTAPQTISDSSTGQRTFPAVAVDPSGKVHVSWFDSRNAPDNPASSELDVYATFADEPTRPFHANARVSSATTDFGTRYFIGDYTGMAASSGIAHPAWTNGYLQTATLELRPRH
ncbi:MAG: sialidase family protein [Thermoanaerobaculales bacterium]